MKGVSGEEVLHCGCDGLCAAVLGRRASGGGGGGGLVEWAEVGAGEQGVSIGESGEGEEEFRIETAQFLPCWFAACQCRAERAPR